MTYRHIAIEGNIGAGKSTLAGMLAKHYNARLILEQFADNNFLPKFYKEPERYAFPLELSFLAERYNQVKPIISGDMFEPVIVSDYIFTKSKLFARVNLKDDEYALFQNLFNIINNDLPTPDLLIYLHAPVNRLQQNIASRGRSYEQGITGEYLEKLQDTYQQYLKQELQKTIIIDMTKADFVSNPIHFEQLTVFLQKDYDFLTHHLSIV